MASILYRMIQWHPSAPAGSFGVMGSAGWAARHG